MGNSSTKESRGSSHSRSRASSFRQPGSPTVADPNSAVPHSPIDRPNLLYSTRSRSSRHDAFLGVAGNEEPVQEPRKETKQEREARKAEKERAVRAKERERSLKEESVDGGYLVTLGTYTGPEDFSKAIVRQLMIERRIAPFWRGLNDHSDSWTEHQLVAAARGLAIPAPDEIPAEDSSPLETGTSGTQPISFHGSHHNPGDFSSSHPVFSSLNTTSPSSAPHATPPLFRGRSKTLASLTSKNGSQTDLVPQEMKLPHDSYVNGQRMEAHLYKDASECPICFLYYPPYLNRTRCCDQPICSECFVQIKRPDPHPPEHTDPTAPPLSPEAQKQLEEGQLVSEPAQCPFCVQTEFGITYEPPPFRRGLAYANQGRTTSFVKAASAMSSSTSLPSSPNGNTVTPVSRRRGQSLSATAPQVITTDKVRPDWAKKLSDARAHAARRSAAATALHNAAYLMGGAAGAEGRFGIGRRRRNLLIGDPSNSGGGGIPGGPSGINLPNVEMLLAALEGQSRPRQNSNDLMPTRLSSRGNRMDDLEELMLMEAIRQSLAAEEERKKKEEKEAAKQAKKDEKQKVKDQKKAEKVAKKSGLHSPGSSSNTPFYAASTSSNVPEDAKGKAKATDFSGSAPQLTLSSSSPILEAPSSWEGDPQQHLEAMKMNLDPAVSSSNPGQSQPVPMPRSRLRHVSDASSSASSFLESAPGSLRNAGSDSSFNASPNNSGQHLPFGTQNQEATSSSLGAESMFNFRSLAAMIGKENLEDGGSGTGTGSEHVEFRKQTDLQPAGGLSTTGASSSGLSFPPSQLSRGEVMDHIPKQEGSISPTRASATVQQGKYEYHKQGGSVTVIDGKHGREATQ